MPITAYMQLDFDNPIAVAYSKLALQSFEPVKDIFNIEVVQCITPQTYLPELSHLTWNKKTPSEVASFHSTYRMLKRIEQGEKLWIMEHDAYLIPEHEDTFRKVLGKYEELAVVVVGMATECFTASPDVARIYCENVERGRAYGNMSNLHKSTNRWASNCRNRRNCVYWPLDWKKSDEWVRRMGIACNVDNAHRNPIGIEKAPVAQLIDPKVGSSLPDRKDKQKAKKNVDLSVIQPWMEIVDISDC